MERHPLACAGRVHLAQEALYILPLAARVVSPHEQVDLASMCGDGRQQLLGKSVRAQRPVVIDPEGAVRSLAARRSDLLSERTVPNDKNILQPRCGCFQRIAPLDTGDYAETGMPSSLPTKREREGPRTPCRPRWSIVFLINQPLACGAGGRETG
jgi:hypothetical protein